MDGTGGGATRRVRTAAQVARYDAWLGDATRGLGTSGAVWDEIAEIRPEPGVETVYDITVDHPAHTFVAAGFEHSVAKMYLLPLAEMLKAGAGQPVELAWLWRNLAPVIAGNLVGGSVLVALVYYVIYGRGASASAASSARTSAGPASE